jgi:hypothetical protein
MTKEIGFLIALCASTALCYALITRVERISAQRRFARTRPDADSGYGGESPSSDGWGLASRFSSGDPGTASSACDSPGQAANGGSCDSFADNGGGGGGDCGGGDSGGGSGD